MDDPPEKVIALLAVAAGRRKVTELPEMTVWRASARTE